MAVAVVHPAAVSSASDATRDAMRIGPHQLHMEGDLAVIQLCGTVKLVEAEVFLRRFEHMRQEYGQLYILFDNTAAVGIEPTARRRLFDWIGEHPLAGVANFGGGVMQRTLALLLLNAIRLLIKKAPPQTYAASEAEARAWLAEQRRRPHPDLTAA